MSTTDFDVTFITPVHIYAAKDQVRRPVTDFGDWSEYLADYPRVLLVRLTRELPSAEISLLGLLEVIFGVLWAWLGAGEQPGPAALIGGTLVIGALLCNELLSLRKSRTP